MRYLPAYNALQQGRTDVLSAEGILRSAGLDPTADELAAAKTQLEDANQDFGQRSSVIDNGWIAGAVGHLPWFDRQVAAVRSLRHAGVGSAVNDSTRLLGGTLGVAVIGSVFLSLYGSGLTHRLPPGLPGRLSAVAHQSVGAAFAVSGKLGQLGHPALGEALHQAASHAFLHGLSAGCLVAAGVAAAGALASALFLPAQPAAAPVPASGPAHPVQASR